MVEELSEKILKLQEDCDELRNKNLQLQETLKLLEEKLEKLEKPKAEEMKVFL